MFKNAIKVKGMSIFKNTGIFFVYIYSNSYRSKEVKAIKLNWVKEKFIRSWFRV
jgi:hypothetical protein